MAAEFPFWKQESFNNTVQDCVTILGDLIRADRISLFVAPKAGLLFELAHTWNLPGYPLTQPAYSQVTFDRFSEWFESFRNQFEVYIPDTKAIPGRATEVERLLIESGVRTIMVVPLLAESQIVGLLELASYEQPCHWASEERKLIQIGAGLLTMAIAREHHRNALHIKDEFLASVSHELRTPLNTILLTIENMRMHAKLSLNDPQIKALDIVERSSEHLLDIVNELIDLANLSSGRQELHLEPVDVIKFCRSCISSLQSLAARKGIHLKLMISNTPEQIALDPMRVRQCLVNLLNLTIRSAAEGGIVGLEVKGDHTSREVSFSAWFSGIGLSTGASLDNQDIAEQADRTAQYSAGASELGLAVITSLVELHGGRVSFEYSGAGDTAQRYTITFPGHQANWDQLAELSFDNSGKYYASEAARTSPTWSKEPLILIVDDNEANLLALRDALENESYRLALARSGEEALSTARSIHPDLVLMDIHMPGIGGLEAIRQIRKTKSIKDVPVIALTAFAMMEDRQKCLEAGANDYLAKPFRLKELYMMVLAWLKAEPGVIV